MFTTSSKQKKYLCLGLYMNNHSNIYQYNLLKIAAALWVDTWPNGKAVKNLPGVP